MRHWNLKIVICGRLAVLSLLLVTTGQLCAQPTEAQDRIGAPTEDPAPLTPAQIAEIEAGIRLHDAGDFAGAVQRYRKVLDENPHATRALYEMGLSYLSLKDLSRAIEIGVKGARYKSPWLPGFYNLLGTAYDLRREPEKAIAIYQEGLEYTGGSPLLRFNLGVTEFQSGRVEQAKADFKQVLVTNPNHSSSHLSLAGAYSSTNERVPALLACLRFLLLEPRSGRTAIALQIVRSIWASYAQKDPIAGPGMKINIAAEPKSTEGDFGTIGVSIQIASAMKEVTKTVAAGKAAAEFDLLVLQYDGVFDNMLDPAKRGQGFVAEYYERFFGEIKQKGFVAPFVAYIFQSAPPPGWAEWVNANRAKLDEFVAWMKAYSWPKLPAPAPANP